MDPQLLSLLRKALTAVGTAAVTIGILKPDLVGPYTDAALILIGGLLPLVMAIWGWWQNRVAQKRLAIATISEPSPKAAAEAKAVLTPEEVARALHPTEPPAVVTITGKVV